MSCPVEFIRLHTSAWTSAAVALHGLGVRWVVMEGHGVLTGTQDGPDGQTRRLSDEAVKLLVSLMATGVRVQVWYEGGALDDHRRELHRLMPQQRDLLAHVDVSVGSTNWASDLSVPKKRVCWIGTHPTRVRKARERGSQGWLVENHHVGLNFAA